MHTWNISDEVELDAVAEHVIKKAETGPFVVGLSGDLGSGKTTFVKRIASLLGVEEHVTSPTFVVMKRYETTHERIHTLVHIDAYRIESVDEVGVLGLVELLSDSGTMICIEWPEKILDVLPANMYTLTFTSTGESTRTITEHYGKED